MKIAIVGDLTYKNSSYLIAAEATIFSIINTIDVNSINYRKNLK